MQHGAPVGMKITFSGPRKASHGIVGNQTEA